MADALVTISARIPKKLNDELEKYAEERGYASKTEVLRELLRNSLYEGLDNMRGALKGKVKPLKGTMGDWRREEWKKALKKAKGDARKATEILDRELKAGSKLVF